MRWIVVVVVVLASSCVSPSEVRCGDGYVCPAETECASVMIGGEATHLCVPPSQIAACSTSPDTCDGTCHDGVCLPNACGNLLLDEGETCDLGALNGDPTLAERCSLDCQSTLTCGNLTIDVATGESCDDGEHTSHDGCSSACETEAARWVRLRGHPVDRNASAIAYDVARRRTVLFGGGAPASTLRGTFEWDGLRWQESLTLSEPTPRMNPAMTYDTRRARIVLFSGQSGSADTWTYDGGWRLEDAIGARPPARFNAGFAFDSNRGVAVLFGGTPTTGVIESLGDTWTWDGTHWTAQSPATSPPARSAPAFAYDPARGVVVMFGGFSLDTLQFLDDTWEYDGTTWTKRNVNAPPGRSGAGLAFDPVSRRLLLAGGSGGTGLTDTWAFDGQAWTLVASGTAGISTAKGVTDSARGVAQLYTSLDYIVEWNGTSWVRPAGDTDATGQITTPALYAGLVAHVADHQVVLFGGVNQNTFEGNPGGDFANQLVFDGSWRFPLYPTATIPSVRHWPAMAYDAKRGEVVMFSGCFYDGNDQTNHAIDDGGTWIYDNDDWILRASGARPPALCGAAMAYDHANERVILFGGRDDSGQMSDDTWAWDGQNWQQLSPAHSPSPRWRTSMAEDPVRHELVLFSGIINAFYDPAIADTWVWDGLDWVARPAADSPPARYAPALAWNPARRRITMIAGAIKNSATHTPDDLVFEWDGTRWNTVAVTGYPPRFGIAGATYWEGGILVYGGMDGDGNVSDELWLLRWDGDGRGETCADVDGDGDGAAGCADADCWHTCTPSCLPGQSCTAPPKLCGNGTCDPVENCATCAVDCTACAERCGNGTCAATESPATCPGDCPSP